MECCVCANTLITGVDTEYSMYVMCRVMLKKPGATRCTKKLHHHNNTQEQQKHLRICARCTFMGEKPSLFNFYKKGTRLIIIYVKYSTRTQNSFLRWQWWYKKWNSIELDMQQCCTAPIKNVTMEKIVQKRKEDFSKKKDVHQSKWSSKDLDRPNNKERNKQQNNESVFTNRASMCFLFWTPLFFILPSVF